VTSPIESISAVTLATPDMAAAVGFYGALGFECRYGGPNAPFTSYRVGAGFVNLRHDPDWPGVAVAAGADGRVWGRVILWVDDVDAIYDRAVAAGFSPLMAPSDAPWGERYFHLRDPSGHELSFARPLA